MNQPHSSKAFPPLPPQFRGSVATGWPEALNTDRDASVAQFLVGRARNFVYCIRDHATRQAVVIDPHDGSELIVQELHAQGYTLAGIWLTHTHWDHIGGIHACARAAGRRVAARADARELTRLPIPAADSAVELQPFEWAGDSWSATEQLGRTAITRLFTPGHSPGEICYLLEANGHSVLFTGDTLFIGDCGRTDLPGGSGPALWESLSRIRELPEQTLVLPGHHYSPPLAAWLGEQKLNNPALASESLEEFLALP